MQSLGQVSQAIKPRFFPVTIAIKHGICSCQKTILGLGTFAINTQAGSFFLGIENVKCYSEVLTELFKRNSIYAKQSTCTHLISFFGLNGKYLHIPEWSFEHLSM
jgi:hypothetical protein